MASISWRRPVLAPPYQELGIWNTGGGKELINRRFISVLLSVCGLLTFSHRAVASELKITIREAQSKVVKIFGAGGFRQLEAYQSGILISPEGHVLTASSYVLDTDDLAVILHDGTKLQAEFLGSDPITELTVLKLLVQDQQLPFFDLHSHASKTAMPGQRILALSNLYGIATGDEPVSVLQGVVTAVAPLRARRGAFQANFRGDVYVLDAYANNPGAAGGAMIDWNGRLLGVLGKELRSEVTGTWLNYALPTSGIANTVEALREGRVESTTPLLAAEDSHNAESLGLSLIPDVLSRTPPYVDGVRRNSPAEKAGLRVDDLIVFVGGTPIDSHKTFSQHLNSFDAAEELKITVLRNGNLRELLLTIPAEIELAPTSDTPNATEIAP